MGRTLGVMLTVTTYGTWLRGDRRGWVDDGKIMPADPQREDMDRQQLKYPPFYFNQAQQLAAGVFVIRSAREKLRTPIWALAIEPWHMHVVTGPFDKPIGEASKEFKLSVLHGLHLGRPIWSKGYDKRWCAEPDVVAARVRYVERHNVRRDMPAQRWPGLDDCPYV